MVMVHIVPLADQVCNKKNSASGYIVPSARGDIFIGQQMRMLVLMTMQTHPGVRIEDGLSQHQCEQETTNLTALSLGW